MEQGLISPRAASALLIACCLLLFLPATLTARADAPSVALATLCPASTDSLPEPARLLKLGKQLQWTPARSNHVRAPLGVSRCWVRATWQTHDGDAEPLLLVVDNPRLSLLRFYQVGAHNQVTHFRAGADLAFEVRPVAGPYPAFPLGGEAGSAAGVAYLEVSANHTLQFSAWVADRDHYFQQGMRLSAAQAGLSGALLLLAMALGVLFAAYRDTLLLYLALWLSAAALGFFNLSGLGHMLLWPATPLLNQYLYLVLVPLLSMLSALSARDFLARHGVTQQLRFNLCSRSAFALLLATPFLPRQPLMLIGTLVLLVTLLVVAVTGLRQQELRARGVGGAALLLLLSLSLWCLMVVGLLPETGLWRQQLQASVVLVALAMVFMVIVPQRRQTLAASPLEGPGERAEDRAQLHARSQFISALSHQIRTPLNGILGMSDLLRRDKHLPLSGQQQAATIYQAATSLVNTVNDILDHSAIQQGTLRLRPVPVQPDDLLSDVVELFAVASRRKAIPILCFIDSRVPGEIVTDDMRVKQVLSNLLSNALRHTDSGHLEISISTRDLDEQRGTVLLSFEVSDTGSGLSSEQVEALNNLPADGTSGLQISHQLVRLLGGELSITGSPGHGCIASFTLPARVRPTAPACLEGRKVTVITEASNLRLSLTQLLHRWGVRCTEMRLGDLGSTPDLSDQHALVIDAASFNALDTLPDCQWPDIPLIVIGEALESPDSNVTRITGLTLPLKPRALKRSLVRALAEYEGTTAPALASAAAAPLSVLVVDDDQVSQLVIASLLRSLGIEADTLDSGEQAVARTREKPYDVVFMDWEMPGLHGAELIDALQASATDKPPWIICLTAHGEDHVVAQINASGVDDLLHKPVNRQQVRVALKHASSVAGDH